MIYDHTDKQMYVICKSSSISDLHVWQPKRDALMQQYRKHRFGPLCSQIGKSGFLKVNAQR
jgi:hypothetical protein